MMDIMSEFEIASTACTFKVGCTLLRRRGGTKGLRCNHLRCAKGEIVRWAGPFRHRPFSFMYHQVYHHPFPFPIRLGVSIPSIPHLPQAPSPCASDLAAF
jgi:hypothetical protein